MIDELVETVKQAEQKAGLSVPRVTPGGPERIQRMHQIMSHLTYDEMRSMRVIILGAVACFVTDAEWDYCLQEAIKPLEGSNGK